MQENHPASPCENQRSARRQQRQARRARIDERLVAYSAVAAAASAVGGTTANAELIFNDFPDVHLFNDLVAIDVDGDGFNDFGFLHNAVLDQGALNAASILMGPYDGPVSGNPAGIVGNLGPYGYSYPAVIEPGANVGVGDNFLTGSIQSMLYFSNEGYAACNWIDGDINRRFLGVRFEIPDSETTANDHLGFIEVSVGSPTGDNPFELWIHGAAWNNVPIGQSGGDQVTTAQVIPEPSSLAVLALGAAGVLMHRRRRAGKTGG